MSGICNRREFLKRCSIGMAALGLSQPGKIFAKNRNKPNIVWIIVEDMSCHFGCYGETSIRTPNIDQLAAEGVKFDKAFITAPVCSPCRSALITGMYQTSIGAHQHRSGWGTEKIHLPTKIRLVPAMFQEAGYYTCNGFIDNRKKRPGKTDYNFEYDKAVYDGTDWADRKPGQPFFAQIQLAGGKGRTKNTPEPIDPTEVKLPPYYPDDPVIRDDWAQYLNAVMNTDIQVGQIVQRLKDEGIYDNTSIFFLTDHGISHARGKQFLYDEGIHVPLIVRGPSLKAGTVREDLVIHIDMAATSLALAGITIPEWMEGKDILAKDYQQRDHIVSARDRCDETVDRIRCVRTDRYKYICNFYPKRPYLQPCAYKDKKEILKTLRRLHKEGKLNRDQELIFAERRPKEELYDLQKDPWELHNLAGDDSHRRILSNMRKILDQWIRETNDQGQYRESKAMYDSDMKVYVDGIRKRGGEEWIEHAKLIERNIALMKKWQAEGR
ncbi:MAG: sulfatase [Sedimentisphaerales bacterium]|nr:sulfatase [Sedimentisphaerales bacterium]